MSETTRNRRGGGKTYSYLLVGLMVFGAAAAARAADWTDANSVTYTALKSINGNGSGVIITDFTPAGTEIVKFKYKLSTVSGNECVFCSRYFSSNNPQAQFCGFRIATKLRFDRGSYTSKSATKQSTCNTTTLSAGEEYSVVANFGGTSAGTVTINDMAQTLSPAMVTASYTPGSLLVLLASHTTSSQANAQNASTLTGFNNYATGDLYYFQLWNEDGETLEHDFRPAKRDSDSAIGLYDTVEQKFWGATVGSFTGVELSSVATATWTGTANNGDFSDSGNWTCCDGDGNPIADAVPESTTDITLGADVSDGWTAFNDSYAGTIDLNGHNLAVSCSNTLAFTVTDSSSGTPGELRITVPEGETFTKTASFGITGNLSLVKDGSGTLLWSHNVESSLAATIPVLVTNGVFKSNATAGNLLGNGGTVTVKAPGQFDININLSTGPVRHRTFYIEGDGPDGSGAIVNSAANTQWGYQLNNIVLTGDATIGGRGFIDIRESGTGVNCGGHVLTVKNTGRLLFEAGTYLTNATETVVNGGYLMAANSSKFGDRVVLQNGGKFVSYMNSGDKLIDTPIVVRADTGDDVTTNVITTAKNYFQMRTPVTVESGAVLQLPNGGPWYRGFTNEVNATIIIPASQVCLYTDSVLKNDGTVINTGTGDFILGHRDNTTGACRVENNGLIRTSGTRFWFKTQSSMTGTGTLELAGGNQLVEGTISGFTGTIRVTGGTATISNVATFPGTLVLADGNVATDLSGVTCDVVFDLSGKSEPFTIPESWLTLPAGKAVTIDLRGRNLSAGDKLLAWTSEPSLEFSLDAETAQAGVPLISTPVGLYYGADATAAVYATWTGAANNGDYGDSRNWTCYDINGDPIQAAVPGPTATITLGADVTNSWTSFNAAEQTGGIDLNGHSLAVSCSGTYSFAVTNSSDAVRGELRITVPEGEVFEKTASFGITGNISLVKDGPGTLLWSHAAASSLDASIPVLVTNGVFKIGTTTGILFGESGTVTVKAPGQFDINTAQQYGPVRHRTFYIEGDGPDGSGAIVNSAANTQWGYQLNNIVLTGDATIGGRGFIDIRQSGTGIDCGGHELMVKNTGRLLVEAGTHLTNATDIVVNGGQLMVCNSCVLGAERIVLENGGTFRNYIDSGDKLYDVPFVVRADTGDVATTNVVTTDNHWFQMRKPITVESGATLRLPNGGPWYRGFTNQTDATIVIPASQVVMGLQGTDSIFKNDGTLINTGTGDLVIGHRDNTTDPCRVENNGLIRTSGTRFWFKTQSSMTGTGTLELAGGNQLVEGTISGFTGTIVLSGGTATISHIDTFNGTLRLKDGTLNSSTSLAGFTGTAVIDVSDRDSALDVDGKNWFTFAPGKEVLIDVGERELQYGDKLLSWSEKPAGGSFKFLGGHPGELRKVAEGVVFAKRRGMMVIVK